MKKFASLILILILMGIIPITLTDCCRCKDPGPDKLALIDTVSVSTWPVQDSLTYYPFDSVNVYIGINGYRIIGEAELRATPAPFSLTPAAYACTCHEASTILQNHISAIQFLSLLDTVYSDSISIKKGTSLNDLFRIRHARSSSDSYVISDFIASNQTNYIGDDFELIIVKKPKQPLPLSFNLIIELSNGTKLTYPNKVLRIK